MYNSGNARADVAANGAGQRGAGTAWFRAVGAVQLTAPCMQSVSTCAGGLWCHLLKAPSQGAAAFCTPWELRSTLLSGATRSTRPVTEASQGGQIKEKHRGKLVDQICCLLNLFAFLDPGKC